MIIEHKSKSPVIDETAVVAPNAVICGDVKIGKNCRIMYGATVIAEGGRIELGENCIVLENAVLRSTERHNLKISNNVLIGPNSHIVGCEIHENVFIATGSAVFHGAVIQKGAEVRINGVVHIKTVIPENGTVPISWIAVGDPAQYFPPEKHDEIWAIQKELNFPMFVYGVERGETTMQELIQKMVTGLGSHKSDNVLQE